jgi:DNA-binding FrmR family transcriptional regulator
MRLASQPNAVAPASSSAARVHEAPLVETFSNWGNYTPYLYRSGLGSLGKPVKSALPVVEKVFVPDERKQEVRRRLARARGQVDGIERMLEQNRPCAQVLQQIAAAQEALRAAGKLMVRGYLEKCATEGIKAGRTKEVYDEFLEIIYRMVR